MIGAVPFITVIPCYLHCDGVLLLVIQYYYYDDHIIQYYDTDIVILIYLVLVIGDLVFSVTMKRVPGTFYSNYSVL